MSTAHEIKKIVCHRCYTVLDVGDNFCRQCGAVTGTGPMEIPGVRGSGGSAEGPFHSESAQGGLRPGWSESPAIVLVSLFVLLGPLALPMLWRSRRFSAAWKIALTVVVVVLTVVMCWLVWYLTMELLRPLREFQMP
ncbi:MAG TPA: hypothetical protein VE890_11225 [Thermoguttaceae bacterium]|nr:hypothetical protein [Thermoguttaceae bacterium]